MAAGAVLAQAALGWADAGVEELLPAERRVGSRHLLSCRRRCGSWRRRIHPDLLRGVPGLGRFVVRRHTAFKFIFYFSVAGVCVCVAGGWNLGRGSWDWSAQLHRQSGGGGGEDSGAQSGHRGQRPISISPPGRRDLGRARGVRRGEQTQSALLSLSPTQPGSLRPQVTAPPPPRSPPPRPQLPRVPARVPALGRRARGGEGSRSAGGLRRPPPPVAAWRLAPLWQPFSAAAAAGALRTEAEAAAARQRRQGRRGAGPPAGGSLGGPSGGGGRAGSPAPPAPPPAALQAERGRSAWRAPAIPPFPRHLVPGLAPSQSGAATDKARPGPAGAPEAHPGWVAPGPQDPRPHPNPPGGASAPASQGGSACDGRSPSPRGVAGTLFHFSCGAGPAPSPQPPPPASEAGDESRAPF